MNAAAVGFLIGSVASLCYGLGTHNAEVTQAAILWGITAIGLALVFSDSRRMKR